MAEILENIIAFIDSFLSYKIWGYDSVRLSVKVCFKLYFSFWLHASEFGQWDVYS
jgi:hypothetical protein